MKAVVVLVTFAPRKQSEEHVWGGQARKGAKHG